VSPFTPVRTLPVRHLQLARAVTAAIAAVMITFIQTHSAALGLGVFSGFAIVTGLVFLMASWAVFPVGRRWPSTTLGVLYLICGMVAGFPVIRTTALFFALVIPWAFVTGILETIAGWRERAASTRGTQRHSEARDAITVGVITIVLGISLLFVPGQYFLRYYIAEAHQSFTLTGITIAVGIFGGWAAIVAVYLGIAAFSPRRPELPAHAEAPRAPHAEAPRAPHVDRHQPDQHPAGQHQADQHQGGAL
jgi:uncharacterized membrane protein HdeD (DUF308 family)